ncbi:MAG: ribosome small subunit-dependent GTPase A, partial [Fimbriiglobus sp.]
KSLATDERNVVTTGDRVWFRPIGRAGGVSSRGVPPGADTPGSPEAGSPEPEGVIERVEPRHGVLTRASRRREHVLVSNVDQLAIVVSLVEPALKPHLIDRYLAAAQKGGLAPVLCLNKIDLADPAEFQPLIGAFARIGVPAILTSARSGVGLPRLRELLTGRATVFGGQSGVGKSSLLNAVEPGLGLRVREVSESTSKGRHTTTTAELIRLGSGGWLVDTPGVRQLQLWDTRPEEVEGLFREFRPFVALCGFPDCTHIHEGTCAVKAAVARRLIPERRYQSYLGMFHGAAEE